MPADEMMATVTRPIEEAMKDIPGAVTVRSATKRGSAQINVFFNWNVDMQQSELYVLGRLSQIRSDLPATAATEVERVTFSAFPIIGISLTSSNRDIMALWETANYELKPRFLQIPGVARVEITRRPRAGISRRRGPAEIAGRRPRPVGRERCADEKQSLRARRHDGGKLSPLPDDGGWARPFGGGH